MFGPSALHRTLEACLRDVDHEKSKVRASAVRDLVSHADAARSNVVGALERALGDRSAEVRAAAAIALADVGAVEALAALLCAVEDDDPFVRQMAITAVGELGDPRSRERLRRALGDERPEVRFQAVIAFARVAPEDAQDAIVGALSDPDPSIRYVAIRVAEEYLASAAVAKISRIAALVDDADADVRIAAAIAVARSGDDRGAPVLIDVISRRLRPKEADDEAAAVEVAGEMGLRAAIPDLERRAFGIMARLGREAFAFHALVALARMGHGPAGAQIVRDLGARLRDRRTLAVVAAGKARLLAARPIIEAMRGDDARADQDAVSDALHALVPEAEFTFPEPKQDVTR